MGPVWITEDACVSVHSSPPERHNWLARLRGRWAVLRLIRRHTLFVALLLLIASACFAGGPVIISGGGIKGQTKRPEMARAAITYSGGPSIITGGGYKSPKRPEPARIMWAMLRWWVR